MWESRNFDFRSFPAQAERTPIYIPERAWAEFERWYGLADQFRFLERQGTVSLALLGEGESVEIGGTRITPVPLEDETTFAFLFEGEGRRILVAMDETQGWEPPDLGPLDLAVLPIGVFELHPVTGERLIPEEFCIPPVKKTRYGQTLEMARALGAARTVMLHVEEMDRLSHDQLVELGELDGWEPAYDGLVIDL
jgi:phosphoribosyl 1,2-cyclic phosphate phosphodiesterase